MKSGFRLLKFIENFYPTYFNTIIKFSVESCSERETIWRFLNNQIEKPKINNIPLKFGTYQTNFPDYNLYLKYNTLIDKQNEKDIVNLCLTHKQPR